MCSMASLSNKDRLPPIGSLNLQVPSLTNKKSTYKLSSDWQQSQPLQLCPTNAFHPYRLRCRDEDIEILYIWACKGIRRAELWRFSFLPLAAEFAWGFFEEFVFNKDFSFIFSGVRPYIILLAMKDVGRSQKWRSTEIHRRHCQGLRATERNGGGTARERESRKGKDCGFPPSTSK